MTTSKPFVSLANVVADLSQDMPPQQRYARLLDAFLACFPCDAIALLKCEGEQLVPCAVEGLGQEVLGHRFMIGEQPRLAQILQGTQPVRFAADSRLPDPYDGFVDLSRDHAHVHDCMGAPLYLDGQLWGVLTLDAMSPGSFNRIDFNALRALLSAAAATVRVASRPGLRQALPGLAEGTARVSRTQHDDALIGQSPPMQRMQREIEIVARTDFPVLILGETGVGKELVARAIHACSARAQAPLVTVNCAALPEALAESELFGHVRGAFSGASEDRSGKFEQAHYGTLFLDEVGELPLTLQAKLLRALQNGDIQRLGSDRHHRVDVRVIAATNRDLIRAVAEGQFRADLYHRLSVYPLRVPALRERGEDVLRLSGHFLQAHQQRLGLEGLRLTRSARDWLSQQPWPGNVRELEHTLARATIRALSFAPEGCTSITLNSHHFENGGLILPAPLLHAPERMQADARPLQDIIENYRREVIRARLRQYDGNRARTAHSLGLDRGNFHRLLKKIGLD